MARTNHIKGLYASIEQKCMRGPAYRRLTPQARVARMELDMFYWEGGRRNPMQISVRWFSDFLGCSIPTAAKVLKQLDDNGFLSVEQFGTMRGPVASRVTVYRLTWLSTNDGLLATFDNRRMDNTERLDEKLFYTSTSKVRAANVKKSLPERGEILHVQKGPSPLGPSAKSGDSQWLGEIRRARGHSRPG